MAEWVYVKNENIEEYHGFLPKSWRDISGLDKADDNFLKTVGWLRVEKNHSTYDERTHKLVGYEYEILSDRVVERCKIVSLTSDEIQSRNEYEKTNFFNSLREQRNKLLKDSDWTQMTDIAIVQPEEWIQRWRVYRQALRDLPAHYKNLENYFSVNIVWPNPPGS